jgi:hypothetical protein
MFEHIEEHEQLVHFCEAYRDATGRRLRVIRKWERPDYICKREDGTLVGVEFTLITRDPESSQWDSILNAKEYMDGDDAAFEVQAAVTRKAAKRAEEDWQLPDSSILVLSIPDCPISDLNYFLEAYCRNEFEDSGFTEIWLADHSEMEAYGAIELFCLHPAEWWGHYVRDRGKPYG